MQSSSVPSKIPAAMNPVTTAEQPIELQADPYLESIDQLETEIAALRDRYQQVGTADLAHAELQERQKIVKARGKSPETKQELQEIVAKLGDLENILESQLMTMEPFWTAVRFGGLGILIGWALKTWLS
jgi:DNA repair exonuclease SbcCD ATPase subunit